MSSMPGSKTSGSETFSNATDVRTQEEFCGGVLGDQPDWNRDLEKFAVRFAATRSFASELELHRFLGAEMRLKLATIFPPSAEVHCVDDQSRSTILKVACYQPLRGRGLEHFHLHLCHEIRISPSLCGCQAAFNGAPDFSLQLVPSSRCQVTTTALTTASRCSCSDCQSSSSSGGGSSSTASTSTTATIPAITSCPLSPKDFQEHNSQFPVIAIVECKHKRETSQACRQLLVSLASGVLRGCRRGLGVDLRDACGLVVYPSKYVPVSLSCSGAFASWKADIWIKPEEATPPDKMENVVWAYLQERISCINIPTNARLLSWVPLDNYCSLVYHEDGPNQQQRCAPIEMVFQVEQRHYNTLIESLNGYGYSLRAGSENLDEPTHVLVKWINRLTNHNPAEACGSLSAVVHKNKLSCYLQVWGKDLNVVCIMRDVGPSLRDWMRPSRRELFVELWRQPSTWRLFQEQVGKMLVTMLCEERFSHNDVRLANICCSFTAGVAKRPDQLKFAVVDWDMSNRCSKDKQLMNDDGRYFGAGKHYAVLLLCQLVLVSFFTHQYLASPTTEDVGEMENDVAESTCWWWPPPSRPPPRLAVSESTEPATTTNTATATATATPEATTTKVATAIVANGCATSTAKSLHERFWDWVNVRLEIRMLLGELTPAAPIAMATTSTTSTSSATSSPAETALKTLNEKLLNQKTWNSVLSQLFPVDEDD